MLFFVTKDCILNPNISAEPYWGNSSCVGLKSRSIWRAKSKATIFKLLIPPVSKIGKCQAESMIEDLNGIYSFNYDCDTDNK